MSGAVPCTEGQGVGHPEESLITVLSKDISEQRHFRTTQIIIYHNVM